MKTIFIVEDDPAISELMAVIVEGEGFKAKVFLDGDAVESDAVLLAPDLIIMDLWISGADGASLVKTLKSKKETSGIPIIIVSADVSLAKIAKRSGADGFLAKPFNIQDLAEVVKRFV